MAWFTACFDRPRSSCPVATVTIGWAGRATMSASTLECRRGLPERCLHAACSAVSRAARIGRLPGSAADGSREQVEPLVRAILPKGHQPRDVGARVGCEDEAHRRDVAGCEAATPEDDVNERAPHAAVPVGEGVDGLELGVGNSGLDEGREVFPVHERDEVVHERLHQTGWRWHEDCPARVEGIPTDPVLARANRSGDLRSGRREHEPAMDRQDVPEPERPGTGAKPNRFLHGGDVSQDRLGRLVARGILIHFRAGQAPLGQDEPLDAGRGH